MKKKKKKKWLPPVVRRISIDPTVSMTMMSTPPGNPEFGSGWGPVGW